MTTRGAGKFVLDIVGVGSGGVLPWALAIPAFAAEFMQQVKPLTQDNAGIREFFKAIEDGLPVEQSLRKGIYTGYWSKGEIGWQTYYQGLTNDWRLLDRKAFEGIMGELLASADWHFSTGQWEDMMEYGGSKILQEGFMQFLEEGRLNDYLPSHYLPDVDALAPTLYEDFLAIFKQMPPEDLRKLYFEGYIRTLDLEQVDSNQARQYGKEAFFYMPDFIVQQDIETWKQESPPWGGNLNMEELYDYAYGRVLPTPYHPATVLFAEGEAGAIPVLGETDVEAIADMYTGWGLGIPPGIFEEYGGQILEIIKEEKKRASNFTRRN